jgi:nucleotidyltransferase substrate binding protein (TIGR01987 family)
MSKNQDENIRWKQRFINYKFALDQLSLAVGLAKSRSLSNLEKQGLIQAFEFTHELSWKVLKDYLEYQGISMITGSRDAVREAFQNQIITHGDIWMEMISSRNKSSHTYNVEVADWIIERILNHYEHEFKQLKLKMETISEQQSE